MGTRRIRTPNFAFSFFTRRGGNYNNGSNAGLGYVNGNNDRGNVNTNYGCRPRSQHTSKELHGHAPAVNKLMGGVCFQGG